MVTILPWSYITCNLLVTYAMNICMLFNNVQLAIYYYHSNYCKKWGSSRTAFSFSNFRAFLWDNQAALPW